MDTKTPLPASHPIIHDIFFLNIENAYAEALKQNIITDAQGNKRLQYCYYDGSLTDIALPNLIKVATDDLVSFFSYNTLPLPKLIGVPANGSVQFTDFPMDILDEIERFRNSAEFKNAFQEMSVRLCCGIAHKDTYFIDRLEALNTAKQNNRVYQVHSLVTGLQACYYGGATIECDLENLFHVELENFVDYFTFSPLRLPETLKIPTELDTGLDENFKQLITEAFQLAIKATKASRDQCFQQLGEYAKTKKPDFTEQPLRVFVQADRYTKVMGYCATNLAEAFARQGFEVFVFGQNSDTQSLNTAEYMLKYLEFNPHITLVINHQNNDIQHEDVINIIWWQDSMPKILKRQPLRWRKNDLNFSVSPFIDQLLLQCGASQVNRLHFCIDKSIFNSSGNERRENKVVFLGSAYSQNLAHASTTEWAKVETQVRQLLRRGAALTDEVLLAIESASALGYDTILWSVLPYTVRHETVHWLCENPYLDVEVYGHNWEVSPVVAKHYHGELPHGAAIADVYRSAKYALVTHPFEINSQRLAEATACGCIPIVYDCRDIAEEPHWNDHCLFFKTQQDLNNILQTQPSPPAPADVIGEYFSYDNAAKKISAIIASHLNR